MPGGTESQRFSTGQPVSPFSDLGYHEATSMYAFFGKSAEPDSGEKYCSLPEESVTVTGSEFQGSKVRDSAPPLACDAASLIKKETSALQSF